MTDRLYYHDSYLTEFRARVIDTSPDRRRIYLDRTAFYPTSGGQPFDIGNLGEVDVTEVVDEDGRIAHQVSAPLEAGEVSGVIDWQRRFDHMQQHTGQHLLSAVLVKLFDAQTVSFHLGVESCTIDVARVLEPAQIREAERRANEIVFENRPVTVAFEDSSQNLGLRKPTEREGEIRIISIQDLDRSACGGTHVRATGEIGPILIRKLDRIRGNQRIEFLCGLRAVKRARADFEAISSVARAFSAPPDEVPALVTAQLEKLQDSDKARRRLATELAQARGRELYSATTPDPAGVRKVGRRVASLADELRAEVQSFTAGQKSVFLALGENPPAIMLAASPDSGINAGEFLKAALAKAGGRGGGSATMAQGSVPSKELLELIWRISQETLLAMAVLLGMLISSHSRALAQSAVAAPLTFEVASIKPSDPNSPDTGLHRSNAKFDATNHTLKRLIAFAYDVELFQISGGPGWVNSDGYDVTAKTPDDVAHHKGPDDDKVMVQALLSDRFKLTLHNESRELPIYALVIGKNGSKLEIAKPHVGSSGVTGRGETHWTFTEAPLSLLVHVLSQRLGRPVVDRTGLTAHYDFKLEWTADPTSSEPRDFGSSASDPAGLTLFTAIQEQLGLRLEAQKGPVEIFVIDHVERPSEN